VRFEEGHSAEAIDDIVAVMILGRRISLGGVNVLLLASYAIEHRMSEVLALYLPRLDAQTIRTLKKRLDALPSGSNPPMALKVEERFALDWLVGKIKGASDKESLLALLGKLCDSHEKGRALFEKCGGTAEGVLKLADQTRRCYAGMATKLDLPLNRFEEEWDREVKEQTDNEVFHWVFPALHKVRLAQLRAEVRRALLLAAIDIQLEGPDALKKHPDPVVGGPFEYAPFEGGFELRSNWNLSDQLRSKWKLDQAFAKPLTLVVGQRGK
jgi:hypothetical protein